MRKIVVMALSFVLIFSFAGCSNKTLTYNLNLGYDLSEIDYDSVEFHVYHSNTENHKWERLRTFSCLPEKNHFADVRVEGKKNYIEITLEDNHVEKTENMESYYTEEIDSYQFVVDGFEGWIGSCKTFEVKDTDEEQFYRLYPISKDGWGTIFNDLNMDRPYDEDRENLDNILITIKIK